MKSSRKKTLLNRCANSTKLNRTQSGFTLIELMIVFVIIIVLAGMVLQLMGLSGVKNSEAKTRERLERVAQALEEFRATYGRYPPVDYYPGLPIISGESAGTENLPGQPFRYEYAHTGMMPPDVEGTIRQNSGPGSDPVKAWEKGPAFTFGLLSYLLPRVKNHAENSPRLFIGGDGSNPTKDNEWEDYSKDKTITQWEHYNNRTGAGGTIGDIVQNLESSRKILPFLGAFMNPDGTIGKDNYGIVTKDDTRIRMASGISYQNMCLTIRDGWDRELNYQSRPPYDSYKLWSNGPDGKSGTDDDMVLGQE